MNNLESVKLGAFETNDQNYPHHSLMFYFHFDKIRKGGWKSSFLNRRGEETIGL